MGARPARGAGTGAALPATPQVLKIGAGRLLREGRDTAILSYGARLGEAMQAAEAVDATLADARFAKPLDEALIRELAQNHNRLVSVEEGARGGFGAFMLDYLANHDLLDGLQVRTLTLPDRFQDQDTPDRQYAEAGLTARDIIRACKAT